MGTLSDYDYLWIELGAIIALLIFSSFQQQVHLTGIQYINSDEFFTQNQ